MSNWLAWQLIDSAFPIGVFAHSWGLEAAWQSGHVPDNQALRGFLRTAIQQTTFGALPLLAATYREPNRWRTLDQLTDAFLSNSVANRASRVQGRTLVATASRVWPSDKMRDLGFQTKQGSLHVAPTSGWIFRVIGLSLDTARGVFLYGTARGVLSAGVRLGIVGSYEAQSIQYEETLALDNALEQSKTLKPEDIYQTAPIFDLIQAGHDRLYSRLFQS